MPPASRAERVLSVPAALVVSFVQWWPAFSRPDATGFGDWQMIHHNWEAAFVALARFHEWPLWDPFHCGGVSILGNPESQLYSPLFALSFVIGTVLAVKVFLVLHVAAALLGAYWLARAEYALAPPAAALSALAWGLSGCFAWDGAGGHATFLPFAFAPWLILCFRRSERSLSYVVATAALLALSLVEGATYPFPYFVLLLGLELVRRLAIGGGRARVLRASALIAGLCALLGAIRLVPIAVALHDAPRTLESTDFLSLGDVLLMLTARDHAWRFAGHKYVWPEYGSYVGWPVLVFAALGLLRVLRGGRRDLLLGLGAFGLLMLGSRAAYYPWPLLRALPVFDSLRVPSRFSVLFTLYLALLAGTGLSLLLERWRRRRWVAYAALLLVGGIGADIVLVNLRVVDRWDGPALSRQSPEAELFLVRERDHHFKYASYPRRNLGSDLCYAGGMNWQISDALWIGASRQARVPGGHGRVLACARSTARASAEVELSAPGRVVFNQNFAPGWYSNTGVVVADRGRLAVALPAGRHHVELAYAPAWFAPSALLSLCGLLIAGWFLVFARRVPP
jgi:hypothetical protein